MWNQSVLTNHTASFKTNVTLSRVNVTEGLTREFISDNVFNTCTGVPRSMWITVTRLAEVDNSSIPANGTNSSDFNLIFFNHQGKPMDPPTPPVPPPTPPTPPRPVPFDKNVTISERNFTDRDQGKTFAMSVEQLNKSISANIKPNRPVTVTFQGQWKTKVNKTGIFVDVYDSYADKNVYSGYWYSNKDSFGVGENYTRTVQWLFPVYIPASLYEVTVSLKDWINPSKTEYAKITFNMDIKDIQTPTF